MRLIRKGSHDSLESTMRQAVHVATGDRGAEAEALADRTGGAIDARDAREAVRRTHGDVAGGAPSGKHARSETATEDDVRAVESERRGRRRRRFGWRRQTLIRDDR